MRVVDANENRPLQSGFSTSQAWRVGDVQRSWVAQPSGRCPLELVGMGERRDVVRRGLCFLDVGHDAQDVRCVEKESRFGWCDVRGTNGERGTSAIRPK